MPCLGGRPTDRVDHPIARNVYCYPLREFYACAIVATPCKQKHATQDEPKHDVSIKTKMWKGGIPHPVQTQWDDIGFPYTIAFVPPTLQPWFRSTCFCYGTRI